MKKTDEFIDHLKATGRFQAFKAQRKALEAENIPKHLAWEQAARSFGWRDGWTPDDTADETEQPPDSRESEEVPKSVQQYELECEQEGVSFTDAVCWAAEHAPRETRPEKSPNGVALSLLIWAREDNAKFMAYAGKYLDKANAESDSQKLVEDDRRRQMSLIDTFIRRENARLEKTETTPNEK